MQYTLPWTMSDNPNGWLEPTTRCQLACPDCYRRLDVPGHRANDRPISELCDEVDRLIELRNVQTLTIAGGEPLIYPDLDNLIRFAVSRHLNVQVITNGILLDEQRIRSLSAAGVTRVMIHVDRRQGRSGVGNALAVKRVRKEYCDLFRMMPDMLMGFIQPIGVDDMDDVESLIQISKENSDVVSTVAFIRTHPPLSSSGCERLGGQELFEQVRRVYGLEYGARLDKVISDDPSWLLSMAVFSGGNFLGCLDGDIFRFVQKDYHKKMGRYLFCSSTEYSSKRLFLHILWNRSLQRVMLRYLSLRRRATLHVQRILVVNTPDNRDGTWDICRACPDAMLHQGHLVPSCMVDFPDFGDGRDIRME